MTRDNLIADVRHLMAAHTVCTLATSSGDGPWAVSLMYAPQPTDAEQVTLYWLSDPKTRHSAHLNVTDQCVITIAGQYDDFGDIKGLQMTGTATQVTGDVAKHGMDLLGARYPFLNRFKAGKLSVALKKAAVYRFSARSITLIDNGKGFGFKETITV